MCTSKRRTARLPPRPGNGQFVQIPIVPTLGVDDGLLQPRVAQANRGPETFAAIAAAAIDDDGLGPLQARPQSGETLLEFLIGQADGCGNVAEIVVDRRTHIDKERGWIVPKRLGGVTAQ